MLVHNSYEDIKFLQNTLAMEMEGESQIQETLQKEKYKNWQLIRYKHEEQRI